jgi:hypothetical protein
MGGGIRNHLILPSWCAPLSSSFGLANGSGNVFDVFLPLVLERKWKPANNVFLHSAGDAYAPCLCQCLQAAAKFTPSPKMSPPFTSAPRSDPADNHARAQSHLSRRCPDSEHQQTPLAAHRSQSRRSAQNPEHPISRSTEQAVLPPGPGNRVSHKGHRRETGHAHGHLQRRKIGARDQHDVRD